MVPPCSDRISRVPPYSRTMDRVTCTGLSPATARLSRRFHFSFHCHWPGPRSLATTNGVSVDVLSSGYLDVSVHRVCLLNLCIQPRITLKALGCPIRKSAGQRLLSPHRGLSQSATSFIASQCQGIHQLPFSYLRFIRPCAGARSHKRLKPKHGHSTNPIGKTCTLAEFRHHSNFQKKFYNLLNPQEKFGIYRQMNA